MHIHQRRREAYLAIAAAEPERCVVIDASSAPEQVEKVIAAAVFAAIEARSRNARQSRQRDRLCMFERIAPEQHDTLDGVPEPSEDPQLFGHDAAVAHARRAYRAGKAAARAAARRAARHRQGDAAFQLAHYLLSHPVARQGA